MHIKGYPLIPYWTIGLLFIALLILVGAITISLLLNINLVSKIIAILTMCTFSAMLSVFCIRYILDRWEILSNIVRVIGPLAIVDKAGLSWKEIEKFRNLPEDLIEDIVNKLKGKIYYCEELYDYKITDKPLKPITFCYIKSPGTVSFRMGGRVQKAKGLAYATHIEVEWQKDFEVTYQLIRHEVGHILFNNSPISRQSSTQHKLMKLAGF